MTIKCICCPDDLPVQTTQQVYYERQKKSIMVPYWQTIIKYRIYIMNDINNYYIQLS